MAKREEGRGLPPLAAHHIRHRRGRRNLSLPDALFLPTRGRRCLRDARQKLAAAFRIRFQKGYREVASYNFIPQLATFFAWGQSVEHTLGLEFGEENLQQGGIGIHDKSSRDFATFTSLTIRNVPKIR
jgi:hypothetical protein